ncbi:MAG: hypothetical protein KGH58_01275 [Candidatus Micrarchaeota archaeon]|nr:hypothetical protein [Candidatus Micrarchaeota archaeon]
MKTHTPQHVSPADKGSKARLSASLSCDLICTLAFDVTYLAIAEAVIFAVFGAGPTVTSLLAGIPLICISMVWGVRLFRKRRESNEERALIHALSVTYANVTHNRKPLFYSLTRAIESTSASMAPITHNALLEVTNRMRLGQDLDEAVQALKQSSRSPSLAPLYEFGRDYRDGMEPGTSLKGIVDEYNAKQRVGSERFISKLQKQVTVSMALGTVVPSFAMFVFVGYSIVYYSAFQYLAFAITMLLVLPCASSALRASVAGQYETR